MPVAHLPGALSSACRRTRWDTWRELYSAEGGREARGPSCHAPPSLALSPADIHSTRRVEEEDRSDKMTLGQAGTALWCRGAQIRHGARPPREVVPEIGGPGRTRPREHRDWGAAQSGRRSVPHPARELGVIPEDPSPREDPELKAQTGPAVHSWSLFIKKKTDFQKSVYLKKLLSRNDSAQGSGCVCPVPRPTRCRPGLGLGEDGLPRGIFSHRGCAPVCVCAPPPRLGLRLQKQVCAWQGRRAAGWGAGRVLTVLGDESPRALESVTLWLLD